MSWGWWTRSLLILGLAFVAVTGSLMAAPDGGIKAAIESAHCEHRLLGTSGYALYGDHVVFGNGNSIRSYPLTTTLHHLGLQPTELAQIQGRVMLLGEGLGHLLPFLSRFDWGHLLAVDPLYMFSPSDVGSAGDLISRYVNRYRSHLIAASGAELPFPDGSIDQIWSHMLINNFFVIQGDGSKTYDERGLKIMAEAFRVLKTGGRAVFAGKGLWESYERHMLRPLRRRPGLRGSYMVKKEELSTIPYEGAKLTNVVRISIAKVGDKAEPAEIFMVR